jgi:REP element-mobilizing transposase RayT
MTYNPQIHHRQSIRLKGYDYSQEGLYFITICCQDRICWFGKIDSVGTCHDDSVRARHGVPQHGVPQHSEIGKIAHEYWLDIPNHYPSVVLHEHIVMPNHVHGIIELTSVGACHGMPPHGMPLQNDESVRTCHGMSPQSGMPLRNNQFSKPIPNSISVIINQYKSSVKRWCNKNGHENFKWQSRFYDHIIRNEQSYQNISEYIINNPEKWKEDKFFYH